LILGADKANYKPGEKVALAVTTMQACNLSVLGVSTRGEVRALFPNAATPNAALAAGALNFIEVKKKIETVISQRDDEKKQKETAQNDLRKTKSDLDKTKKDLTQTQEKLASTEQERDAAVSTATAATKRADELTAKLADTNQKLKDTAANLASYEATGYKPQQILTLDKQIKNLESQVSEQTVVNKGLRKELDKKIAELEKLLNPEYHVKLPPNLEGKILVADPKWDFVVVSVGDNDDVKKDGELLVNRGGRLVAKLRVTEVQKDRSIANVMPGWKKGDVMEGDQVFPAYLTE